MIVYLSMILWVLLVYFFYSSTHRTQMISDENSNHQFSAELDKKIPILVCLLVFGYFIFWIGLRGDLADTGTDIWTFNNIPTSFPDAWNRINWDGRGPGYEMLAVLFKSFISKDANAWLMTIAIISGCCIVIGLRRYSCDFFYSSYLFITLLIFYWMINGMRQFLCVAIVFAFSHWIEKGKIVRLIVLALLLYFIHITALVIIPLYFVARGKPWTIKTFAFILIIAVITLFSEPFFKNAETVFGRVAYQGYTDQFHVDDGVNVLRVLFTAVFPALALWKRHELEKHYEDTPVIPICINMSLVTTAIFFVGMFTSGILVGRMPIYSEVFNMLLIPYLLKYGFSESEQRILRPFITIILFVFFYLKLPHYYHSDILNITSYEIFG